MSQSTTPEKRAATPEGREAAAGAARPVAEAAATTKKRPVAAGTTRPVAEAPTALPPQGPEARPATPRPRWRRSRRTGPGCPS
ncbi:hypothetical protein [Streptomyces sp. KY70]|uniref:hypothetical protein n=1 Tax=Streptomyces sp. KY70 TaxID=2772432 RepID=UPI001929C2CD|nr:hypothetical protein [Streptomyces sp. KY70]CAD5921070.1 protein of unknown function [Streptomyces sp. KY70]